MEVVSFRPSIFGAAVQVFGIEKVAPVHYMASIIAETGEVAVGGDAMQQVDPDVASAVLPATIIGHVLPVALMSLLPMTATEVSRSYFTPQSIVCHLFYLSPLAVSSLTMIGSRAIKWFRRNYGTKKGTADEKTPPANNVRRHARQHDGPGIPALQTAYAVAFGLQALQHVSTATWILQEYPDTISRVPALFSVDGLGAYKLATALAGVHTVWDLRRRGYVTTCQTLQAIVIFGGLLGSCGTGAAYAGLWYWRERVLDSLRHRARSASLV